MADRKDMTPPRVVLRGQTVFLSIRCVRRTFQLVPTRKVVKLLDYVMTEVGSGYRGRVCVHGFIFMSNHIHILLTDVEGCYPDFVRDLASLLARNLNALRGENGKVFEEGYGVQILLTEEEVLEKLVYMYGNPVRANLVAKARQWKSCCSLGVRFGVCMVAERPRLGIWKGRQAHAQRHGSKRSGRAAYALRSKLPEVAELPIVRPPIMSHLSDDALHELMLEKLAVYEAELAEARVHAGKRILGWRNVVRVHHMETPGREEQFNRTPHFSGGGASLRVRVLRWYKEFLGRYYDAVARFRDGDRAAVFPDGTFKMRQQYGVACCPVPDW